MLRQRTANLPSVNMRALILLVCLLVCCLAQRPRHCFSPPLLTGELSLAGSTGNLTAFVRYSYDALGQRIRLREAGSDDRDTFHKDYLLLYREGIMYKINSRNQTCSRAHLETAFHPLMVPKNGSFIGQVVLGSSSGPGEGVLVNTWEGEQNIRNQTVRYFNTVTSSGCFPISTVFYTKKTGWVVTSFFNSVLGITDPLLLIPPSFCNTTGLGLEDGNEQINEELLTFFSVV